MIGNNVLALFAQGILSLMALGITALLSSGGVGGVGKIPLGIILFIGIILWFLGVSRFMSERSWWAILFPGLGVFLVGIAFLFIGDGSRLIRVHVPGESLWQLPLDVFFLPQFLVMGLLGIPFSLLTMIGAISLPWVFSFLGLLHHKWQRVQRERRRRG